MNSVVFGGSGFLGSYVADALTARGHQTLIYDLRPSLYASPRQRMVVGDILDAAAVARALEGAEVVYHLASLSHNHQLVLRVWADHEEPEAPSVASVWRGAHLQEREAYDLLGIRFSGHPNLRRILLYEEFQGHPLRKDYPIRKRQPLIGPTN